MPPCPVYHSGVGNIQLKLDPFVYDDDVVPMRVRPGNTQVIFATLISREKRPLVGRSVFFEGERGEGGMLCKRESRVSPST